MPTNYAVGSPTVESLAHSDRCHVSEEKLRCGEAHTGERNRCTCFQDRLAVAVSPDGGSCGVLKEPSRRVHHQVGLRHVLVIFHVANSREVRVSPNEVIESLLGNRQAVVYYRKHAQDFPLLRTQALDHAGHVVELVDLVNNGVDLHLQRGMSALAFTHGIDELGDIELLATVVDPANLLVTLCDLRIDAQAQQADVGHQGRHEAGIQPATIRDQGDVEPDVVGDWQHLEYPPCIEQRLSTREVQSY